MFHPIYCVQVVISIEGMTEREEEETFTEEINTFVISVDGDETETENGLCGTVELPVKYTLVE